MTRGALIVVEGLDRAGKSTQVKRLAETISAVQMRFPDRTTSIGHVINDYLGSRIDQSDHAIHLLFSANRWESLSSIMATLNSGKHVVIDRYSYSGAVYSAAKCLPNLSLSWAWQPEIGLPKPDRCIFLDIEPEDAARRGGWGDEKYEVNEFQQHVRRLFKQLIAMPENDEMVVVDAGRPFEQVQKDVLSIAEEAIEAVNNDAPLRTLGPLISGI